VTEPQALQARVAFVGAGDLALRTLAALDEPEAWRLIGLARTPQRLPPAFQPVVADYSAARGLACLAELAPQFVVASFKPLGRDVEGYRRGFLEAAGELIDGLGRHRPQRVFFVSSTRVYAESEGAWVDEDSALASADPAAAMLVAAEQRLQDSGLPLSLLRCAGLYGGDSTFLLRRVATGSVCPPQPLHYSNRMHRDDVGRCIAFLLARERAGTASADCYNLVDDAPVPQHEVEHWLAAQLGLDAGRLRQDARPMTRGHKRCSNARLRATGFALRYPDYRAGYAEVLTRWQQGVSQ